MREYRTLWAAASLVIGGLQAWDAGALEAGEFAQSLIAIGILLPPIAIAANVPDAARIVALAGGALLLLWARLVSPVSLNALHLALFVPAVYILFVWRWQGGVRRRAAP